MDAFGFAWLVFGALIGYIAAARKGWSPVAGVLGGMLLGLLSPLLFFVSGVTRSDKTKICPQCAERVKFAARVCRYCGAAFTAPAAMPAHAPAPVAAPTAPSGPSPPAISKWHLECVDRATGVRSAETIVALDEREAFKIIADRGKMVARIVSVTKLGK